MARTPRILGEGIVYHVINNCNNNEFLFQTEADHALFLEYLREARQKFGFDLYGYQLMQSHTHLIIKTGPCFLDEIMHWLCHGYSEHYNKVHGRRGHFWRERYKAKVILDDLYAIGCLRYVHRNILEAGVVGRIEEWPWTCYRFYTEGLENDLITPLPTYLGLGQTAEARQSIYKQWVETPFLSKIKEKHLFTSNRQRIPSLRQKQIFIKAWKQFNEAKVTPPLLLKFVKS